MRPTGTDKLSNELDRYEHMNIRGRYWGGGGGATNALMSFLVVIKLSSLTYTHVQNT